MRSLIFGTLLAIALSQFAQAQQFVLEGFERETGDNGILFYDMSTEEIRFFSYNDLIGADNFGTGVNFDPYTGLIYFGEGNNFYAFDPITETASLIGRDPNIVLQENGFSRGFTLNGFGAAQPFSLGFQGISPAISDAIDSSSAVASALEIQLPTNGASNRVGLTNGTFGDEHAFGVSYARVQGRFDVGLAYAQGDGGRNAGKISVGFSW